MKTPPVSGGLHPRNIRQLDKAIRCNSCAETPPFRMTGFEISEFLTTHRVDKEIVRFLIQSFGGTRKSTTEFFQLRDVHERSNRRLTNQANPRDEGQAAGPPRSFQVEREVGRPRFGSCCHSTRVSNEGHGGMRLQDILYFHLCPSALRSALARSSATIAIRKRQLALNLRKNGSAKNGIRD